EPWPAAAGQEETMLHFKQGLPWIAAGFVALAGASPSQAQGGAEFFKGKTVTYIVATAPGGGYDAYGRLVAEYMQKYLPGSTFVVKNMPGAGHVIGANAIYASKPDGLTIGSFNTGLIYNQLIGLEGVKFDLTKMSWIGKAASDPRVITCAEHSPIKTFEDLRASKEPVKFATAGIGSASYVETVMLTNALRLPAKVLTGYNGNQDQLAMRRKEVDCTVASRSTYEQFVDNKYGRFVAQVGGADKDVPQLAPLVADPTGKQLIALIQSQTDIVRFTAGPPGIAGERLEVLRNAYRKALEDKELQAKAEKLERPVDPSYGEDVLKAVQEALNQTPQAVAVLKEAMTTPKEGASGATAAKGTIAELTDGARKLVLKLDDGKTFEAELSGSRTEITVAGQKADRNSLKAGMACTVDAPGGGAEAKAVSCN
ncbi:MAG TPA: tripartite tricarboxylate transporter substrate-binding protein, partial [Beijerinckiaceae bacterium]|nr:tripartite tricarboxylate transporter substrate-binding protein [Beijerinckiaceae bacterium]